MEGVGGTWIIITHNYCVTLFMGEGGVGLRLVMTGISPPTRTKNILK